MKKSIFVIVYLVIVVLASSAAAEIGLRAYSLFDENFGRRNARGYINRKYSHEYKPNSKFRLIAPKNNEYDVEFRINNYGFRGPDITLKKNSGVIRILAIGDSFTIGWGCEEESTIPRLIENRLNDSGIEAEVINAGYGHYSTALQYVRLRDEYLDLKPDIVLLFFDFSDLPEDRLAERHFVHYGSGGILRYDPTFLDGKRSWWLTAKRHSFLGAFLYNKIVEPFSDIKRFGLKAYLAMRRNRNLAKSIVLEREGINFDPITYDGCLMLRGRDKQSYIEENFRRYSEKYLNLIHELLERNNIPMILVVFPRGNQVGPMQWSEGRQYWGFEKNKTYDDHYAFDIMTDYARRNSIPCINALPYFLKSRNKKLFFDFDGHFTSEANAIMAAAVTENGCFKETVLAKTGN